MALAQRRDAGLRARASSVDGERHAAGLQPATARPSGWRQTIGAYVGLTKPRIIELLLITTVPAMFAAQRQVPPLWLALATLVAYSRVHTGVHYPGDVIVGSTVGSIVGPLASYAVQRWRRSRG